jgi:Family of unknown function (DUF5999)
MCTHDLACPAADAIDWWAARTITAHPGQGWTLLCNGALVFDDRGALLPDGRVATISDAPRPGSAPPAEPVKVLPSDRYRHSALSVAHGMVTTPGTPGHGPGSSVEQMRDVFHELHADGRHALCAICDSQYRQPPS